MVPDGKFGPATESAVKRLQKANGLVADGIVGPKTLAKLRG
jgi:peptidoglycan hydrolase-like protein with peptidoglycan-binding domain